MIANELADMTPTPAVWHSWARQDRSLDHASFADMQAELLDRTTPYDRRDEVLCSLLRIGATDPTARLAVVILLVPGLRRSVARYGRFLDLDDRWGTILAALWEHACRYDTSRRPHHVAANLIWDATGSLLRVSRHEQAHVDRRVDLTELEEPPQTDVEDSGIGLIHSAVAAGVLTEVDAALIDATRLRGVDLRSTAILLGLSYEAAKKRRRRAEVAWAHWWNPRTSHPTALESRTDQAA